MGGLGVHGNISSGWSDELYPYGAFQYMGGVLATFVWGFYVVVSAVLFTMGIMLFQFLGWDERLMFVLAIVAGLSISAARHRNRKSRTGQNRRGQQTAE